MIGVSRYSAKRMVKKKRRLKQFKKVKNIANVGSNQSKEKIKSGLLQLINSKKTKQTDKLKNNFLR